MSLTAQEIQLISDSGLFDAVWYAEKYPDVGLVGLEPLEHFLRIGIYIKRNPCPLFDCSYYLSQFDGFTTRPEIPLLDYLQEGWRQHRNPHPLFDLAWYFERNEDIRAAGIEPLAHFRFHGGFEGRQPHPAFPTYRVLERCPWLREMQRNPLEYYLSKGWAEDPCPEATTYLSLCGAANPTHHAWEPPPKTLEHIPREKIQADAQVATDIRAIAIYLPQFHAIPENDEWWGKGFTEWTNVRRAAPQYEGHYQPHVPHPDIGYYDLNDASVLEKQAAMARAAGIEGFCFYYYWFNGRRLLNMPTDRLLATGKPDFPFCFCWANENWTRTWDGGDKEILLGQDHSYESDERFIQDLLPAFRDPRYIRVDGKPLLVVYRPGLLPDPAATARHWRETSRREGIGEIFLAYMLGFEAPEPQSIGFDCAIQMPPLQGGAPLINDNLTLYAPETFAGQVRDYREMRHFFAPGRASASLWPSVCPMWDNTARRMERAHSWIESSPENYRIWINEAVGALRKNCPVTKRFLFINAWNEWAEGCHLEPDEKHGYAFINATRKALQLPSSHDLDFKKDALTRNPSIKSERLSRLEAIFQSKIPQKYSGFIVDYFALFSVFLSKKHKLLFADQKILAQSENQTFAIESRECIHKVSNALWGNPNNIAFCFVLLQYNKWEITQKCVESIRRLAPHKGKIHIVIVDNASAPEVVIKTRALFEADADISIIFNKENLGFARGNNVGYKHAKANFGSAFIVVMNNDVIIEDNQFISKCCDIYRKWSYSVLGPDIVTPDRRHENPLNNYVYGVEDWQASCDLFLSQKETYLRTGLAKFERLGERTPQSDYLVNPILQGACYIFSPIFVHWQDNPFDDSTFLYGEEFLLAVSCCLGGHLSLYSGLLEVRHEEGVSTGQLTDNRKMIHGYDGALHGMNLSKLRLKRQADAAAGLAMAINLEEISKLTADGRKHILVDLFFCQPGFHGGGEYGKAVFRGLVELATRSPSMQLWVAINPDLYIDEWVWEDCRRFSINIVCVKSYDDIVTLVGFECFYSFFAPAIVVYTGYEYMKRVGADLKFSKNGRTRIIGTLHDVRDLEMASNWEIVAKARKSIGCKTEISFSSGEWSGEKAKNANHATRLLDMYCHICSHTGIDTLVTVSDYSAQMIKDRTKTNRDIQVLFAAEKTRPSAEAFAVEGIDFKTDSYLLVVNAGRIEKNAASAIVAFDSLLQDSDFAAANSKLKLLVVGINGINDLGLRNILCSSRVVVVPYLSASRYEYILSKSGGLIYPSFSEGFGYPPVEAMSLGIPSVVSSNTSIPEVCGDVGIYCDPFDLESIKAAIKRMISSPPDKNALNAHACKIKLRQNRDLLNLTHLICGDPKFN